MGKLFLCRCPRREGWAEMYSISGANRALEDPLIIERYRLSSGLATTGIKTDSWARWFWKHFH
jgi:hypothetical protein